MFSPKNFALRLLPIIGLLLLVTFMVQAQEGYPEKNYRDGKCYARYKIPIQYKKVPEKILVKPEHKKITIVPAQYENRTEPLIIEVDSAETSNYKTITEIIEVKPASTEYVVMPAKFETVKERIQIVPENGRWEVKNIYGDGYQHNSQYRGHLNACMQGTGDPKDCNILCWVKIPAQYQTITIQQLVSPATIKTIEVPAEYKTIAMQVINTPEAVKSIEMLKEQTITKQVLLAPAQIQEEIVPAEYITVTKTQLVQSSGCYSNEILEEEVVCDADIDEQLITKIQQVLKKDGYYKHSIDGTSISVTIVALRNYQQDKNLHKGNISVETLKFMGIY